MSVYYTEEHEWIRVEGDQATVGITDFAQGQLDIGRRVGADRPFGEQLPDEPPGQ